MDLPPEILAILAHFAPLLSHRVWPHAHTLLLGAVLVNGRRTVASALRVMGLGQEPHYTNYHRVLNRATWSALAAAPGGGRRPRNSLWRSLHCRAGPAIGRRSAVAGW